jgi:hypothetical protein
MQSNIECKFFRLINSENEVDDAIDELEDCCELVLEKVR